MIDQQIEQIVKTEKAISFAQFFKLFVEELEVITNTESKALFEYWKGQSKVKNAIDIDTFHNVQMETMEKIRMGQDTALSEAIQSVGAKFYEAMSKVRMTDLGHLSKISIKEQL